MKKLILLSVLFLILSTANAQFKVGIHGGIPGGKFRENIKLNLGADLSYTLEVVDGFDVGIAAGYTHYFVEDMFSGDAMFIPVAATSQYSLTENFFLAGDIGYAIGLDGNDSGFLYHPKIGFKAYNFEVYTGFKGISGDGWDFNSFNFGLNFKI